MVNQRDKFSDSPPRSVQRDLVEILNDDIVFIAFEMLGVVRPSDERIGVSRSSAMHLDAIQIHSLRSVRPRAAQQIDAVAECHDATENLLKVKLGSAGLRIGDVLPVENEYPH
jgi:hypothetical protein